MIAYIIILLSNLTIVHILICLPFSGGERSSEKFVVRQCVLVGESSSSADSHVVASRPSTASLFAVGE